MELNREKLKRMFEDTKGTGGSTNSGGGGGSLAGYATQAWVNEGFVSIEFFNRLFTVYGPGATSSDPDVAVEPNDLDSTITNIKAMFGLWTEQYLSALGLNPGGTGSATSLGMLDDVLLTSPANGQTLLYDGTNAKWYNSALKTINGQSLLGSGDISVGGGASGNYLPLSGGTLTNSSYGAQLTIMRSGGNNDAVINYSNSSGMFGRMGLRYTGDPIYVNKNGSEYRLIHEGNISTMGFLPLTGGELTGQLRCNDIATRDWNNLLWYGLSSPSGATVDDWGLGTTNKNGVIRSNANALKHYRSGDGTYEIIDSKGGQTVNGLTIAYIKIDANQNCIESAGSYDMYISYNNPRNVYLCANGGNVGIGTNSVSYKLQVSGSIYATGAITALSDIKQKNVEQYDAHLGFDEVANAPIIKFTWKDPKAEDKGLQVGSIAQYWEKVLPEAVKKDKDGTLSMSYGVVALVAAISTAKKVQEHERRIAELERENKELKERLKIA